MEEEERQNLNQQRLRFGEPDQNDAAAAVAGGTFQYGGHGGAGQAAELSEKQSRNHSKRSVRIADGVQSWQSSKEKQATIRINEARNKTKIKVILK